METKTRAWLIVEVLVWVVSGTQLTFTACELVLYAVGRRNECVITMALRQDPFMCVEDITLKMEETKNPAHKILKNNSLRRLQKFKDSPSHIFV